MTRRIKKDNNRYFGPYTSAKAVRETIEVIKRLFPVRTCNRKIKEGQKPDRPLLKLLYRPVLGPLPGKY